MFFSQHALVNIHDSRFIEGWKLVQLTDRFSSGSKLVINQNKKTAFSHVTTALNSSFSKEYKKFRI